MKYRGYTIERIRPPVPSRSFDWAFAHEDYDGLDDPRCGYGPDPADCREQIDDLEDDVVRFTDDELIAAVAAGHNTIRELTRVLCFGGREGPSRKVDNAQVRVRRAGKRLVAEGRLASRLRRRYDAQSSYTKHGVPAASCRRDYLHFDLPPQDKTTKGNAGCAG